MSQPATVLADAAAEHQRVNAGPVHQIGVVPVVDAGTDQDRALAFGVLGRRSPFACETNQHVAADPRVLLAPGRRVRRVGIVVVGGVLAGEPTIDAVLRHQQVVGRRDLNFFAVGRRQRLDGNAASANAAGAEVVELDLHDGIAVVEEAQLRIDLAAVLAVLQLQIPLPFLRPQRKPLLPMRHLRAVRRFVPHQELPLAVLLGPCTCSSRPARSNWPGRTTPLSSFFSSTR